MAATERLLLNGQITRQPVTGQVAAISCGIFEKSVVLDLDYAEDSQAETDANFVLTADNGIVEVQATAEADPYTQDDLMAMLDLAKKGAGELFQHQQKALDILS
jgi:ribonuclease PH